MIISNGVTVGRRFRADGGTDARRRPQVSTCTSGPIFVNCRATRSASRSARRRADVTIFARCGGILLCTSAAAASERISKQNILLRPALIRMNKLFNFRQKSFGDTHATGKSYSRSRPAANLYGTRTAESACTHLLGALLEEIKVAQARACTRERPLQFPRLAEKMESQRPGERFGLQERPVAYCDRSTTSGDFGPNSGRHMAGFQDSGIQTIGGGRNIAEARAPRLEKTACASVYRLLLGAHAAYGRPKSERAARRGAQARLRAVRVQTGSPAHLTVPHEEDLRLLPTTCARRNKPRTWSCCQ